MRRHRLGAAVMMGASFLGIAIPAIVGPPGPSELRAYASTVSQRPVSVKSSDVVSLPGGGQSYEYDFSNGRSLSVPVPPAGFDPMTATDAQLAEYAFPPRPSQASDLEEWQKAMESYRSTLVPTSTGAVKFASTQRLAVQPAPATVYSNSPNWGGYFADGTAGTYVAVKDAFVVPAASQNTCSSIYGVPIMGGLWIGLGGWNTGVLIQEGLLWCDLSSSPGWQAFGEGYPGPPGPLCATSFFLTPGHTVYMNMSYQQSNTTAYFYVEDENTGAKDACAFDFGNNSYYDGSSADYISEQLMGSNCITALVDYSSFTTTDAEAELGSNGSWVSLGSQYNVLVDTGYDQSPDYWSQYADGLSSSTSFVTNWANWTYTNSAPYC